MEDATKDTEEQKEPLKLRIEDLNKSLSTLSDLKQDIKVAEQQKKRIKELAAEEKELAKELRTCGKRSLPLRRVYQTESFDA